MDLFWRLAEEDVSVRQQAVVDLITQVKAHHASAPASKKPVAEGEELQQQPSQEVAIDYVVRRLVRGLASDRLAARQGFAAALTQLLASVPEVKTSFVLDIAKARLDHVYEMAATEKRDFLIGEVFFLLSLARAGRLPEVPLSMLSELVRAFTALGANTRMKTLCTQAIASVLPALSAEQLLRAVLPAITAALPAASDALLPDDVLVCLALRAALDAHGLFRSPELSKPDATALAALPAYVRTLLTPAGFPQLIPALSRTIRAFPAELHPVWIALTDELLNAPDVDVAVRAVRTAPAAATTTLALFLRSVLIPGFIEGFGGKRRAIALTVVMRLLRELVDRAGASAVQAADAVGAGNWLTAQTHAVLSKPVVTALFESLRELASARTSAILSRKIAARKAAAEAARAAKAAAGGQQPGKKSKAEKRAAAAEATAETAQIDLVDATGLFEAVTALEEGLVAAAEEVPTLAATLIRLLTDPATGGNRMWDSKCNCSTIAALKGALTADAALALYDSLILSFTGAEESALAEVRAAAAAALDYEQAQTADAAVADAAADADAADDDDDSAVAVVAKKRTAARAKAFADLMGEDGDDGSSGAIRRLAGTIGDLGSFLAAPAARKAIADVADSTRQWALDMIVEVVRAAGRVAGADAAAVAAEKAGLALRFLFRVAFFTAPAEAAATAAAAAGADEEADKPVPAGKRGKTSKAAAAGAAPGSRAAAAFYERNPLPAVSEKARRMCVVRYIAVLQELLTHTAVQQHAANESRAAKQQQQQQQQKKKKGDSGAEEGNDAENTAFLAASWCSDTLQYWRDLEAHGYTLVEPMSEGAALARAAAHEGLLHLRASARANTPTADAPLLEEPRRRALARARALFVLTSHLAALQLTDMNDFSPVLMDLAQVAERACPAAKKPAAAAKRAAAAAAKKGGKKSKKADSDDEEESDDDDAEDSDTAWIEVVVDLLLSLLVKPSALLRTLAVKTFAAVSGDLTATALGDLLRVVASTKEDGDDADADEVDGDVESEMDEDEFEIELDEDDEDEDADADEEGGFVADSDADEDDAAVEAAAAAAIARRKAAARLIGSGEVVTAERRRGWDAYAADAADGESASDDGDDDSDDDSGSEDELDFGRALRENPGTATEVEVSLMGAADGEDDGDNSDQEIDMATLTEILAMDAYTSSGDGVKTSADVALQQLVQMKRQRTRSVHDLRRETMNFKLRVLDLIEVVIKRHGNKAAELMLYEPLLVALAACTTVALKPLHDRIFGIYKNQLCRPYNAGALPAAPTAASAAATIDAAGSTPSALALKEVLDERLAASADASSAELLAFNVIAITRLAGQFLAAAASPEEWTAAQAALGAPAKPAAASKKKASPAAAAAAAPAVSDEDLSRAVRAARAAHISVATIAALDSYFASKRSSYNHRFFADIIAKLPVVAWTLLPRLAAALGAAPTVFLRNEAATLIGEVLRSKSGVPATDVHAALIALRPVLGVAVTQADAVLAEAEAARAAEAAARPAGEKKEHKIARAATAAALGGAKGSLHLQREFVKEVRKLNVQFTNLLGATEEALGLALSVVRNKDKKEARRQEKFKQMAAAKQAAGATDKPAATAAAAAPEKAEGKKVDAKKVDAKKPEAKKTPEAEKAATGAVEAKAPEGKKAEKKAEKKAPEAGKAKKMADADDEEEKAAPAPKKAGKAKKASA
jgi:hypothetical protein